MEKTSLLRVAAITALITIVVALAATAVRIRHTSQVTVVVTPTPTPSATATVQASSSLPTASPTATASATAGTSKEQAEQAYQAKQYDVAIPEFQTAIAATSDAGEQASLWNELGNTYRDKGTVDLAITAYQKATTLDPHLIVAYSNLSAVYVSQNNRDKAKTVLEAGLQANPDNTSLTNALSVVDIQGPGATR